MLEGFLVCLHALDFAAHAFNLLLHRKHILDSACALLQDSAEAFLGFTSCLEPGDKVGVLLRYLFAGLRFVFDPAKALACLEAGTKP